MSINNIKLEKYENIYVYGFGLSGRWFADNSLKKIKNFIDTDLKKSGKSHNNVNVLTINEAKKLITNRDLIIVSVVDIQDVTPILKKEFQNIEWLALGVYLNEKEVEKSKNFTEEDLSFIQYSLNAVEKCHKAFISKDKLFLRSIDIVISEKCSLKCRDCSNLMQYYLHPKNFSYEQIKTEFQELTKNITHVFEVRLIGGEPFMNKQIYEIIDYFLYNSKISKLVIYTNGTIPLKKDRIKNYNKSKLVFTITDYGNLSKNTDKVYNDLINFKVPLRRHPPENWTDSGTIHDFQRTENQMKELFDKCCGKNLLTSMNGKLYRCPFAANAESFKGIPHDEKNSIPINSSADSIEKYTKELEFIPACNFCKGRSFDSEEIVPAIQVKKPLEYKKY